MVCFYCSHLVYRVMKDECFEGCGLVVKNNKYARGTAFQEETERLKETLGIDTVFVIEGCERFDPSGRPAHPLVAEAMTLRNPKAESIPLDEKAKSMGFEGPNVFIRYLSKENRTDNIQ